MSARLRRCSRRILVQSEKDPVAQVNSMEQRVLVLPSTGADGKAMGRLFDAHRIPFVICKDMAELCALQAEGAATLLVSEEALSADANGLLGCIAAQPVWSDLPIIVLSRSGRETAALGDIVARLGNVSVVERPVRTSTLASLVRSSLRARDRQYQVRQHLVEQEHAQQRIRESMDSERAARNVAEQASRTKDEFLATLSHELRTPLNAILGWTQVMRRSRDLRSDAPNALNVIERNARAQAQIIQDLLDMSSIISGKIRLDVQRLDLASIIAATIESIRPAAEAKGIRLQIVMDPMAGPVRGDPNRLQQVFWNLLTNAVKFTPKQGRILITLARVNSHLEVEVADNGEGIDPGFLPYVFERFRQGDASSTRHHGGLGLGLSIVKQLVDLHGGQISAGSGGKDLGATFRVMLPLMVTSVETLEPGVPRDHPRQAANVANLAHMEEIDLSGVKVLVVDDEPDARALIERLLSDCNAVVVTAASVADAITALARESPHILISDIGMPGEDGFALIRQVRATVDQNVAIPAIALTAYARTEDRIKAIQAGYQMHLAKPVEPVELLAMVRSLATSHCARGV
jgi:signal transduction histidine kinase/ActR/RegA family two-component response regulator